MTNGDVTAEGLEGPPAADAGSQLSAIADAGFNRLAAEQHAVTAQTDGSGQLLPAWQPPKDWMPPEGGSGNLPVSGGPDSGGRRPPHPPSDGPTGPKPPDSGSAVPSHDRHPHVTAGAGRHDESPRSPHSSWLEDWINERKAARAKEEARDQWNSAAIKRAELRDPGVLGDIARRWPER